jgi:hypothetical protein
MLALAGYTARQTGRGDLNGNVTGQWRTSSGNFADFAEISSFF